MLKVDGIYDLNPLLDMLNNDEAFLKQMSTMFVEEDCPSNFSALQEAVSQKDALSIKRAAHKLAGAVANFGAASTVAAARAIETCGHNNNLSQVDNLFSDFSQKLDVLKTALLEYANS